MQRRIPTVFMRGGTSRALFFREGTLPEDPEIRDRVILAAMGSPDPYRRQLDGVGGAVSSTSKVAVIGPGTRPDVDVNYTFGQVSIDRPLIDRRGNCGNISSAVGPYAVDEGMVPCTEPITPVRFLNTNTNKVIVAHVPTRNGQFDCDGDFTIPGVPTKGSRIVLDYLDPGGAVTGRLLPTGRAREILDVPEVGQIEASLVDAANPLVFLRLADLGLTGEEQPDEIDADPALLRKLEAIRAVAGVTIGLARTPEELTQRSPMLPLMGLVAPPRAYRRIDGQIVDPATIDLTARAISSNRTHRSFMMTGAICTTIAASLPGTLVHEAASARTRETGRLRLGHPSGTIELIADVRQEKGSWCAEKISVERTARRLMEGFVLVPDHLFAAPES